MAVKALGEYKFPAKDRQEIFGDDMLVNVHWEDNLLFCSAACFRAPKAMTWSDFKAQMIDPWASCDPDYDPSAPTDWRIGDEPFAPHAEKSLADLGVRHKGLIKFRT